MNRDFAFLTENQLVFKILVIFKANLTKISKMEIFIDLKIFHFLINFLFLEVLVHLEIFFFDLINFE